MAASLDQLRTDQLATVLSGMGWSESDRRTQGVYGVVSFGRLRAGESFDQQRLAFDQVERVAKSLGWTAAGRITAGDALTVTFQRDLSGPI